jgi:hypothetical protein
MFPTLPQGLVAQTIRKHTDANPDQQLTTQDIQNILIAIYVTAYIEYQGNYFLQKRGTPTGYTVSGTLAEIVFQELDDKIHEAHPDLPLWKRYKDDIIIVANKQITELLLNCANKFHPEIKFTIETETNRTLNFLDLQIKRLDHTFEYKMYTKPSQTDRTLNFNSHHPKATKANVIKNEAKRIQERTLKPHDNKILQNELVQKLLANDYPPAFIQSHLRKPQDKPTKTPKEPHITTTSIPYLGPHSEHIKRILQQNNVRTFFTTLPNCRNLTKPKPSQKIEEKTDVVYKIPCFECPLFYIGQTKQTFAQRTKQHERDIEKLELTNAIAKHKELTQHNPNWQDAEIVFHERRLLRRLILETATIETHRQHTVNLNSGPYRSVTHLIPTNYAWPGGATVKQQSRHTTNDRLIQKSADENMPQRC